jgi:hypothetical protein
VENGQFQPSEEATNPAPQAPLEPHHPTRRERRNHRKMILFISGGAALLLLLLGGLYWFFLKGDDKKADQAEATSQQQSESTPVPEPADPTPVVFKSTKYNIELTHRKDWKLKEASSGEVTITSPTTSYTRSDGKATTGVFTVKFRVGVPEAMQATIEKAVAARDSEVIAYDDPPESQRFYTNLSYAGQKDVFNFFIITGNTALKAGNSFAYTLVLDGEFYMLVGGFGSDKDGTLSFDSVPPSMIDSGVAQQAVAIVKSLKIF